MRKLTLARPTSEIFVTSDTHFGHKMVSSKYRGFEDPNAHDRHLIQVWNELVPFNAVVIMFGDVSFTNREKTAAILNELSGEKYVIPGNHDDTNRLNDWFGEDHVLPQLLTIKVIDQSNQSDRISFEASHYPLASWNGSDRGALMLHGHLHSRANTISHHFCAPYTGAGVRFDVGIDNAAWFGLPLSPLPLPVVAKRYRQALSDKENYVERGGLGE